jgi:hypothetical protein
MYLKNVSGNLVWNDGVARNRFGGWSFQALWSLLANGSNTTYQTMIPFMASKGIKLIGLGAVEHSTTGGFGAGLYDSNPSAFFARMDAVLAAVEQAGMSAIIAPTWHISWFPSVHGENMLAWTNPASVTRTKVASIYSNMIPRYLNHPAVAGWQIFTEPDVACIDLYNNRAGSLPDTRLTLPMLTSVLTTLGQQIRSYDPNRIILSGSACTSPAYSLQQQIDVVRACNPDPCDVISSHPYRPVAGAERQSRLGARDGGHYNHAHQLRMALPSKPVVFGEYGFKTTDSTFGNTQATQMDKLMRSIAGSEAQASLMWNWMDATGQSPDATFDVNVSNRADIASIALANANLRVA